VPLLTRIVAYEFIKDDKVSRLGFYFSAICPFLITNGLVLVRDGWITALYIGGIYAFLRKKYIVLILIVLFLLYLRVSALILLIITLFILIFLLPTKAVENIRFNTKLLYFIGIIIFVVVIMPVIMQFLQMRNLLGNLFFREDLLEFISREKGLSAAKFVYNQPSYIRIPLSFIFYFGSPFLSLKGLWYNNFIIIRYLIQLIFPFLFLFYFKYFLQSIYYSIIRKEIAIAILIIIILINILLLSQLSLQIRHKTMLMPLFYIVVANGYYERKSSFNHIASVASIFLLIFEVLYVLIGFFT